MWRMFTKYKSGNVASDFFLIIIWCTVLGKIFIPDINDNKFFTGIYKNVRRKLWQKHLLENRNASEILLR